MDKSVAKVIQGFLALDEKRRNEFLEEVMKYRRGSVSIEHLRESILESANTVNFGPAPTGCPCCGK